MTTKKRKSNSGERFIPGDLQMTSAEFFDVLEKSTVMAFEMVSSLRPLALNYTQLGVLLDVLEKRNKTGKYQQVALQYSSRIQFTSPRHPIAIVSFKFLLTGKDNEPMDAFAVNDFIDELAPLMLRKSGPADMRQFIASKHAKTQKTE